MMNPDFLFEGRPEQLIALGLPSAPAVLAPLLRRLNPKLALLLAKVVQETEMFAFGDADHQGQ